MNGVQMNTSLKWILAILLTLSAAVYQRLTGPTYPKRIKVELSGKQYKFKLPRSHGGQTAQEIKLVVPDTAIKAELHFRRFKMNEEWQIVPFQRQANVLIAELPGQPPAGKLEYFIVFKMQNKTVTVPQNSAVVIRFKGKVPALVLIPHVLGMFLSMLLAMVTFFEALSKGPKIKQFTLWTTIVLFAGGMILGPLVQKFAFGAYWTGVPFGWDLTDNKTLIAMIFWLIASWRVLKGNALQNRWWVILAVLVMFIVFLIPHSMMGSELNYQTMTVETGH